MNYIDLPIHIFSESYTEVDKVHTKTTRVPKFSVHLNYSLRQE